jgi:hypothetical protein
MPMAMTAIAAMGTASMSKRPRMARITAAAPPGTQKDGLFS